MAGDFYIRPQIFVPIKQIVAAQSLRNTARPGYYSMLPVSCSEGVAADNRRHLAAQLDSADLLLPHLQHGDHIWLDDGQAWRERPVADAIITNRPGRLIGVSTADCVAVLLYDPHHEVVAAVHSGWRGTVKNITGQVIGRLEEEFKTRPSDLRAYLSPAPNPGEYEVGLDVAAKFAPDYLNEKGDDNYWLDNKLAIVDQLLSAGVQRGNIEVSPLSSFDQRLHSHRRDGVSAGRHVSVIGIKYLQSEPAGDS